MGSLYTKDYITLIKVHNIYVKNYNNNQDYTIQYNTFHVLDSFKSIIQDRLICQVSNISSFIKDLYRTAQFRSSISMQFFVFILNIDCIKDQNMLAIQICVVIMREKSRLMSGSYFNNKGMMVMCLGQTKSAQYHK